MISGISDCVVMEIISSRVINSSSALVVFEDEEPIPISMSGTILSVFGRLVVTISKNASFPLFACASPSRSTEGGNSQFTSREVQLPHLGRRKSHLTFIPAHCRQDLFLKLGRGPFIHLLPCLTRDDSISKSVCQHSLSSYSIILGFIEKGACTFTESPLAD